MGFNIQTAFLSPQLCLFLTQCGTHTYAEGRVEGRKHLEEKKEKLIEESEVEQMQCERRQKKMSSESIKA